LEDYLAAPHLSNVEKRLIHPADPTLRIANRGLPLWLV